MKKQQIMFIALALALIIFACLWKGNSKYEGFSISNPFDKVDVIYYINLDHREDRKTELTEELNRMGVPSGKVVRISAVLNKEYGDVGCSMSHVKTMNEFVKSGKHNCIIFEDDFEFSESKEVVYKKMNDFFDSGIEYDVCMLSANTIENKQTKYDFVKKVISSQTASGYMVNQKFAKTLLTNFEEGVKMLKTKKNKEDPERGQYCVDQYWKKLQPKSNWYEFNPKLGKQRKSHSDIQGGMVDYNL
jgi:GR25 family glycosyltransferase involved in LPS biosynthesis